MNEPIIFQPLQTSSTTLWLIGCLLVCVAVLIYSLIKKQKTLSVVSGLIAVIMLGSTIFSWLSNRQTIEITILDDSVETMYGTIYFKDIQNVYIEEEVKSPVVGEEAALQTNRKLMIETTKRKFPLPFPESTFQIDSIKRVLDGRYRYWKDSLQ